MKTEKEEMVERAKEWLTENVWSAGDSPEEEQADLEAMLSSDIPDWMADFTIAQNAELTDRLAEAEEVIRHLLQAKTNHREMVIKALQSRDSKLSEGTATAMEAAYDKAAAYLAGREKGE